MLCLWQGFSQQNISDALLNLLMDSWTTGTKKQYSPHISRWVQYCYENNLEPHTTSMVDGAEFLAKYFSTSGVEYSVMNTARSALSAVIRPINSVTFGSHPLVKMMLKGIFKERPSIPKYTVTYDVNKIFTYIKSLDHVSTLSLDVLTKCTATMLCLLSGQRSHTLGAISLDFMHLDESTMLVRNYRDKREKRRRI